MEDIVSRLQPPRAPVTAPSSNRTGQTSSIAGSMLALHSCRMTTIESQGLRTRLDILEPRVGQVRSLLRRGVRATMQPIHICLHIFRVR